MDHHIDNSDNVATESDTNTHYLRYPSIDSKSLEISKMFRHRAQSCQYNILQRHVAHDLGRGVFLNAHGSP